MTYVAIYLYFRAASGKFLYLYFNLKLYISKEV